MVYSNKCWVELQLKHFKQLKRLLEIKLWKGLKRHRWERRKFMFKFRALQEAVGELTVKGSGEKKLKADEVSAGRWETTAAQRSN